MEYQLKTKLTVSRKDDSGHRALDHAVHAAMTTSNAARNSVRQLTRARRCGAA